MRAASFLVAILLSFQLLAEKKKQTKASEFCNLMAQEQETDSNKQLPKDKRAEFILTCAKYLSDDSQECTEAQFAFGCETISFENEKKKLLRDQDAIERERYTALLSLVNEKLEIDKDRLEDGIQQYNKRVQVLQKKQVALDERLKSLLEKYLPLIEKATKQNRECGAAMEALIRTAKKMLIDEGASFQQCSK